MSKPNVTIELTIKKGADIPEPLELAAIANEFRKIIHKHPEVLAGIAVFNESFDHQADEFDYYG